MAETKSSHCILSRSLSVIVNSSPIFVELCSFDTVKGTFNFHIDHFKELIFTNITVIMIIFRFIIIIKDKYWIQKDICSCFNITPVEILTCNIAGTFRSAIMPLKTLCIILRLTRASPSINRHYALKDLISKLYFTILIFSKVSLISTMAILNSILSSIHILEGTFKTN